jgi:hypothetical protein
MLPLGSLVQPLRAHLQLPPSAMATSDAVGKVCRVEAPAVWRATLATHRQPARSHAQRAHSHLPHAPVRFYGVRLVAMRALVAQHYGRELRVLF